MSAIEHVVVLMMENRSFDEYFGTFPGVAGFGDGSPSIAQPWPSQPDGVLYPWRMSTFTTDALQAPQLEHDWISNHLAINADADSGIPDNAGFYITAQHQPVAMGCYLADDIPYYWALAQAFALCDHYFCSVLAGTYSNRMFLVGGTITDPSLPPPASGIYQGSETGGTQYNGTDPVLYNFGVGQYGQKMPGVANVPMVPKVTNLPQWGSYLADLWNSSAGGSQYRVYDDWNWQFGGTTSPLAGPAGVGTLNAFYYYRPYQAPSGPIMLGTPDDPSYFAANYKPNPGVAPNDPRPLFAQHVCPANPEQQAPFLAPLTWILPPFNYSDHPVYTSADGSYYMAQIVDALMGSRFWESTVLIITYDESNTHFDHLTPPLSPSPQQVLDGLRPFEPWVQDLSGTISTLNGVNYAIDYPAPIGAGMRVPTIIVSPWTYQRGIVSAPLDHTSILQLMETVSGVTCSGLPARDSSLGWRRANFTNLYQVIDPENAQATPAQQITGVPGAAVVQQWRANANMRLARQSGVAAVPPASQAGPPVAQACTLTLNPDFYDGASVLAEAAGRPDVTFPGAVTVVVTGFQAQEFVEPYAGVPPLMASLTEVPVAGGASTCRTRVPVPQVVSGASPGEISIGSCSQVSADPNLRTGQQEPLELTFTFPLTFTDPVVSFAFRKGTARVLGLQAAFTVDAGVTAAAQLTLVGGTLVLHQPEACMMLAGQIAEAEKAVYEASQEAPFSPGSAEQLHQLELALGKLQAQYAKECGPGSASGPAGPLSCGQDVHTPAPRHGARGRAVGPDPGRRAGLHQHTRKPGGSGAGRRAADQPDDRHQRRLPGGQRRSRGGVRPARLRLRGVDRLRRHRLRPLGRCRAALRPGDDRARLAGFQLGPGDHGGRRRNRLRRVHALRRSGLQRVRLPGHRRVARPRRHLCPGTRRPPARAGQLGRPRLYRGGPGRPAVPHLGLRSVGPRGQDPVRPGRQLRLRRRRPQRRGPGVRRRRRDLGSHRPPGAGLPAGRRLQRPAHRRARRPRRRPLRRAPH
jgi:phospholipase C